MTTQTAVVHGRIIRRWDNFDRRHHYTLRCYSAPHLDGLTLSAECDRDEAMRSISETNERRRRAGLAPIIAEFE